MNSLQVSKVFSYRNWALSLIKFNGWTLRIHFHRFIFSLLFHVKKSLLLLCYLGRITSFRHSNCVIFSQRQAHSMWFHEITSSSVLMNVTAAAAAGNLFVAFSENFQLQQFSQSAAKRSMYRWTGRQIAKVHLTRIKSNPSFTWKWKLHERRKKTFSIR